MNGQIDALLVEDNPGDADLVRHYLDNPSIRAFLDGVDLTHVESLAGCREALDDGCYDVVMLDLGLPETEGLETLREVTATDTDAPIIVLTGLDNTDVAIEAIQVGAQDYLPKGDLDGDRLARSLRYAIERREQERILEQQNERLDFFNSILRHDMMNGLNVIMAQAEMLERDLEDPGRLERVEAIREWSDDIHELAEKVRSILDSVTTDDASLEAVSLPDVVDREVERVRAVTERVRFDVSTPETCRVQANDLLDDVVGNVLTNAVDHTDGETTVSVDVVDAGSIARLRVADDGPGIPSDDRTAVFERGEKGAASSGTGFGLYFVSSMVESYGGSVRVEDSDSGGAAFVIDLQRANA